MACKIHDTPPAVPAPSPAAMLHTIANPFSLTHFLLDGLPPQWQGNSWVKQQAFYHPARVFILGQDDLEQITDFLAAPMPRIANAETTRHDFAHWARQSETPCAP